MKKYRLLKDTMFEMLHKGTEYYIDEKDEVYNSDKNKETKLYAQVLWRCSNRLGIWAEEINDCHLCNGQGHIYATSKTNPASQEKKDCPECSVFSTKNMLKALEQMPGGKVDNIDDIRQHVDVITGKADGPIEIEMDKSDDIGHAEDIGHVEEVPDTHVLFWPFPGDLPMWKVEENQARFVTEKERLVKFCGERLAIHKDMEIHHKECARAYNREEKCNCE